MTSKIQYKSEWVDIRKAIAMFEDLQSFIDAAAEAKIRTQCKITDSRSPESPESYTDIEPNIWNDYSFAEHDCSLSDPNYMCLGGVSREYRQIRVKKEDLILWFLGQRYSGVSNELQEAIKKAFAELYIAGGFQMPLATDVYNKLEAIQKDIPCITKFDRNSCGEKIILWQTADGQKTSMTFGTFKNLLITIRKQIKEIEKHT